MNRTWNAAIYSVLITGVILLTSCGGKENKLVSKREKKEPAQVTTVSAEPREVGVAGVVRAADVAELAGRVGGFISQVLVKAGQRVQKGELLVVVDERNLQAQSEKLNSASQEMDLGIREAQSQLEAAEAQKQLASNTYERILKVYRNQAASRQEFEEAESRKKSADAAWQAAAERVAQVQSRRQQLDSDKQEVEANLGYVRLTAPFEGLVTSVPANVGTFANPGQTLVVLEKPSDHQVVFSVEEDLLETVQRGETILVAIPSQPGSLKAVVSEVSPTLNSNTRTFQVKADLEKVQEVRSGVSAKITLRTRKGTSLWIPLEFLVRDQDLESVMVKEGNTWDKVMVKSGRQKDKKIEILAGLNEGDVVGRFEVAP